MADAPTLIKQKISFRFAKLGSARFFSHHDIMRHFERGFKRAGLQVLHSRGFNPRPRMVFPHPLPLGVASLCEEIEVEFSEEYPLTKLHERLALVLQPCIELLEMTTLKNSKKGRVVTSCTYRVENFPDMSALVEANREMLAASEIMLERGHGRKCKRIEIRRFIQSSELCATGVIVTLSHFTQGAGRVDEIGKYLAERLGLDWHNLDFTKIAMNFKE